MKVVLLWVTPNALSVIEKAGRTSYQSFGNADDGSAERFVRMLVKRGHTSVLEHASASFNIEGGSRAFTHQLVRHRLSSFTQQSQRYVDEKGFEYVTPPSISANPEALGLFEDEMNRTHDAYKKLRDSGITKEDARYVLPNAASSDLVFTANFRELRHVFAVRCAPDAQWEIREICLEMLKALQQEVPAAFDDFKLDEKKKTAISKPG